MVVNGTSIYLFGTFEVVGSTCTEGIARYDTQSFNSHSVIPETNTWGSFGLPLDGDVKAIYVNGTDIYVGGEFGHAGLFKKKKKYITFCLIFC